MNIRQHQSVGGARVSYLGLLGGNAVDGETSLHVVDQTEVLAGLLDADHV